MNSLNKKLLESLNNLFESQSNVYIKPPFNKYYRVSTPAEIADLEGLGASEFQNFEAEDPVREYTNVVGYAIARDQYRDQIEKASGLLHAEIGEDGKLYYNIGEKVFEVETDDVGINYDEMGREIENEVVKSPSKGKKIIKELDDRDNTSSIYIDLREIISYAEKYISNELKANGGSDCKITTAQDGQYMITLNRSDNSIKAYCDLGYGNASEELDENKSKGELKEEVGYNKEETVDAVTKYYTEKTGAKVTKRNETHNTGGGLSHSSYTRVTFDDQTVMTFIDNRSHVQLEIYNGNKSEYEYQFDVWNSRYKSDIDKFINGENPSGYRFKHSDTSSTSQQFTMQDAIDNKGDVILELQDSGDNKEQMFEHLNKLPEDTPAIKVEGMWNTMNDGTLMTVGKLKQWLDRYHVSVYGGRDTFVIYENLVYLKIGS